MPDLMSDLTTADVLARMRPEGKARKTARQLRDLMYVADPAETDAAALREKNWTPPTVGPEAIQRGVAAATGVPGLLRAGRDMYEEPSLANATDLGTRAAMMAARPAAALKILGAGYGVAAGRDLMGPVVSPAEAQQGKRGEPTPAMPGLAPEQAAELAAAKRKVQAGAFSSGTDRRTTEATIQRLEGLSADYVRQNNQAAIEAEKERKASEQRDYDNAVNRADYMRSSILAKDKSFKDSEVGKVYDKTGGYLPFLAGATGGLVSRMAHGAGGSLAKQIALPAAEGAGLTFATLNAPLVYDAYSTPAKNPEREAAEAYARELPPTHPRKAEFTSYAAGLPEKNQVREDARGELFSPMRQVQRVGTSLLEGAPTGVFGAALAPAARRGIEAVGEIPGALVTGARRGFSRASEFRASPSGIENKPSASGTASEGTPPAASPLDLMSLPGLKPNRLYGEQASPRVQNYLVDAADRGTQVAGMTAAQLARDLNLKPTQAKDAMANLKKIAAAEGIDINDPAQLRKLALRLNTDPRVANKSGTGSSLWSTVGPAIMAPAAAGLGGLLSDWPR